MVLIARRKLLFGAAALVACRHAEAEADAEPAKPTAASQCALTHDNIEGPYYRAGAPDRWDLTTPGMKGTPLEITGRVTSADCVTPLRDVELDVWQANDDGHYDNDGTMPKDVGLLLRGRIRTDGDGRYRVKSILPGHYLNGPKYRPAHVHVKLRATSHAPLTTQLYFPDDPYNDGDPFIHRSLVMDVKKADGKMVARFDFALRQVTGRT